MKPAVALFAALAFTIVVPSASAATLEIVPGSFAVRALDAEGHPEARAGSHPDRLQVEFGLNAEGTSAREFALELPPGLSGDPGAVPKCPREVFEKGEEECPAESQVGTMAFELSGGGETTLPIFEVQPGPGEIIAFGSVPALDATLKMELRPDDLGITFTAGELPEAAVSKVHAELWGVPADHQAGTSIPRLPFLTMPTRCGPAVFGLRVRSMQPDAPWLTASTETEAQLSDCASLDFAPQLGLQLGNPLADSPTGARIDLSMQEGNDPDGLASAQVKNATIQLPEGLTVSPGGVAGITACSDAQLGLGETTAVSCPPSSRVGAMEIASPELPEPLTGDVYLGEGSSGARLRLFVVASVLGGSAKFVSQLHADPTTGRLSAALADLPQLPLARLTLSLDGGPRALLAAPLPCGSFAAAARFESYAGGAPIETSNSVTIGVGADGSPCQSPPAFAPRLVTSSSVHAAGHATALSMTLLRRAGEQLTRRFAVSFPRGVSAVSAGIEACPEAAAAAGACPASSKIGEAVAEVGSGSSPLVLHGEVYLGGPYRRAPSSMVIVLHAVIGPFDLGGTATRAAVQIDPRTGQATVVTDPLPQLVEGIPVRIQAIGMTLDRPGVIRNPTSCAPADFDATFEANSGAMATATSAMAVNACGRLGFAPRFAMVLSDRSQLHRRGKPGFRISAHLLRGDTNLRALRMSLPSALTFDVSGLGEICPRRDAAAGLCSAKARVGTAYARTPLLSKPLRGYVYLVQPEGEGLPDLGIDLAAVGVQVEMRGRTAARHGHLLTSLVGLPDMPLSAFTMRLRGGKHGPLSLDSEPCGPDGSSRLLSALTAKGQDGASRTQRLRVSVHCGKAAFSRHG